MVIAAGTRLGPYEVVSQIGAGGMGEVFKARDTRLDRSVAIKVLPSELTHNAQLRVRFEREAKTISQLTHPHICTLHDVGSENGVSYLVMELLDGETLADRIARGPLPLHDVLRYGAQIADALGKAHRHGVVHRDLKPGNIMITKSGAKLLDFGLAKAAPFSANPDGATMQKSITQEGTILGTFQYMAPEQLEGLEADPRTDIFAFGAVLYEMATGTRAFAGKTRTSLIASIVSSQPRPLREIQPLTPPAFEHVVAKCLEKDPDDRWQSAQDVAEQLRWITGASTETVVAKRRSWLPWAIAAFFALLAIAAMTWSMTRREPRRPIVRATIPLPPGHLATDSHPLVAISPDSSRIVFQAYTATTPLRLWVRQLDRMDATPLIERGRGPFFSPDGEWIGVFGGNGKLRKIAASGGAPITLADAGNARGGSWGSDGYIYYSPLASSGIWRVPADGGEPRQFTAPDTSKGENSHRWPQVLPDGKHLLMIVRTSTITSFDEAKVAVLSLESGKWQTVLEGARFARYTPTGHLVFARGSALHAVRFDLKTMRTSGTPVRVIDAVESHPDNGVTHFDFSARGDLIYSANTAAAIGQHMVLSGPAGTQVLTKEPGPMYTPRMSPDGRTIAVRISEANDAIWTYDIARGALSRLTFEPGDESSPVWTPDGRHVVYASTPTPGTFRVAIKAADGSGDARVLAASEKSIMPTAVSPDGQWVACVVAGADSRDIHLISLRDGTRRPLVTTPFEDVRADFSPDGKWLVYMSIESGKAQVYVRSMVEGGGRWQVSTDLGSDPCWSRDGREIIYLGRGAQPYRVSVTPSGNSLTFGNPRPFGKPVDYIDPFDVTPDGRLLLVEKVESFNSAVSLTFVENWFADLERRVPKR